MPPLGVTVKLIATFVASALGVGTLTAVVVILLTEGFDYLTDPRPARGTPQCEYAQQAVFTRWSNRKESPIEYVREVNHACK